MSQTALAQDAKLGGEKVERVVVTGSAIKRVDAETAAPVEIYTKKDIERTGATSVAELIKNLASIDINDQGELSANSPSGSGTTNIKMRGLSERNVLILLNGRRLPTNALADGSGAGAAVDVNVIPLSALERIEILKDGGSAIYGADAVAGVMNFITKKNYQGLEVKGSYGQSSRSDAKEKNASLVWGLGDYDQSGFNVLATVDVLKRDPIFRKDRDITSSADFRRLGGIDARSGYSPNGNVSDGTQLLPCAPGDLVGKSCRFDFNKTILTSINGADRVSGMLIGSLKVNNSTRAFAELTYSENKDHFEAQPAPGAYKISGNRTVLGRFMQIGPRITDRKGSLTQFTTGLEGNNAGIDWDVSIGKGISKASNQDSNYLQTDLFNDAIAKGLINPASTNNSPAEIDKIRLSPFREGKSELTFFNAKASAPIMDLAGGPLAYAVGVSYNKESLTDTPDQNQVDGLVFGGIQQAKVDASRNSKGIFGELSIPFLKSVEAQLALRYDDISSVGSKTSPKVALRYQPIDSLMFRGSYAGSFLAPSLKQMFGGVDAGANSTDDKDVCNAFPTLSGSCSNFPYYEVTGSNKNLKPETGKTYNFGVVFSPVSALSISVDYFKIKKENEIGTLTVSRAVELGHIEIVGGEARVLLNNQNLAKTHVAGVDTDIRYTSPQTAFGKFTLRNAATVYTTQETMDSEGDPMLSTKGTYMNPKYRNTLTLGVDYGAFTGSLITRTTGDMIDSDKRVEKIPAGTRQIPSHTEVDFTAQYQVIKNLTLTGGIKNLFDRMPPYSLMGSTNQYGTLGFAQLYNARGRYFYLGANYKFF
ncbi:TonB-dependent receptor [Janthinobacterium agaricidamnosum]|uniref:TonB-dependent receptor n=1 Tax=Janthinobacterium agaricidamnosum TaxID=55508 RepID=UPI00142F2CAC|nr:TonB-dependent receptor [Janthinobacterium agaricidamnosum]